MTADQWFSFWMTLIQTVGGGLVTLGGVGAGFWFARSSDNRARTQDDIERWTRFLSEWSRKFHDVSPLGSIDAVSNEEVESLTKQFYSDAIASVVERPAPRNSVDDFVRLCLLTAPFGVKVDWPPAEQFFLSQANSPAKRTLVLHQIVVQDLLQTLLAWRSNGIRRRGVGKAIEAHMAARGLSRVPEY